jgi:hypothetical protein
MTSAVKELVVIDVAVRQTPFTAIESPIAKPVTDFGAEIVKTAELSPRVTDSTEPSSVISPVNIYRPFTIR